MKRLNKHISLDDFKRYRANQMSEAERNAFERELQKNPFEAEALEGFQSLTAAQIDADLKELEAKLQPGKRKSAWPYWAAAASILILLLTGILINELSNKPILEKVAQQVPEKVQDPAAPKPTLPTDSNKLVTEAEQPVNLAENSEPKSDAQTYFNPEEVAQKLNEPTEKSTMLTEENAQPVETIAAAPVKTDEQPQAQSIELPLQGKVSGVMIRGISSKRSRGNAQMNRPVRGQVIDKESGDVIPGVSIIEKGTTNGTLTDLNGNFSLQLTNPTDSSLIAQFVGMQPLEFKPSDDSLTIARMETDQLGLDEVVVIGYGSQRKQDITGSITTVSPNESTYDAAQPLGGMQALKDYLAEKAQLPADYPADKVVVRIKMDLNNQGQIIGFENRNNADDGLFAQACQFLKDGTKWKAANRDGKQIESTVSLRIVFHK